MFDQIPPKSLIDLDQGTATSAEEMTAHLLAQFEDVGALIANDTKAYTTQGIALPKHLQTTSKDPSIIADILHISSFEDEYDRISQADIARKNRCSVSEYVNQWLILHCHYEHSGYTDILEYKKEQRHKSAMYFDRFSPQHPITIFADHDPSEVIAVLPRHHNPSQLLQGNGAHAVDQFISYAGHDRPDVSRAANHALLSAVAQVNKMEVSHRQLMQAQTADEIIKVLKYFNPSHPLVVKLTTKNQEVVDEKIAQAIKSKPVEKIDDNVVNDIDLADMGI